MNKEFESELFATVDDLIQERDVKIQEEKSRKCREEHLRSFYNGLPIGEDEKPNHLVGYKAIAKEEATNYSIYSQSKQMGRLEFDTGNPEIDQVTSAQFTKVLNEVIYSRGKFGSFWRSLSGEVPITGRLIPLMPSTHGWCPEVSPNILIGGEGVSLPEHISYAFAPKSLSMASLRELKKKAEDEDLDDIKVKNVDALIDVLKAQIKHESKETSSSDYRYGHERNESKRDQRSLYCANRKTELDVWIYYEVKQNDDCETYVSEIMFTDPINVSHYSQEGGTINKELESQIIYEVEEAYDSVEQWIPAIFISDSEIGGSKDFDTAKGVAEITYSNDLDVEDLLDAIIRGDKMRAVPRFQDTGSANQDDILNWDHQYDLIVPEAVQEFKFTGGSTNLPSFQILASNSASLSGSATGNSQGSGDLRVQSLQKAQEAGALRASKTSDMLKTLEMLLEQVVERIFFSELSKDDAGTRDYDDIMWAREELEDKGFPKAALKELGKKAYGRFKYLRVRAVKPLGGGDRDEELAIAEELIGAISNFAPQVRPLILQKWLLLRTGDPDFATSVVQVPETIINQQRVIAENEFDTMFRRAVRGTTLPIGADDIHQDHIDTHLVDLEALIMMHEVQPWTALHAIAVVSIIEHIGEHLQVLLGAEATRGEGVARQQRFQQVSQAAAAIAGQVRDENSSPQNQLTEKERVDLQLREQDQELKARALGLKEAEFTALLQDRQARNILSNRAQYAKEVASDRQLAVQEQNGNQNS